MNKDPVAAKNPVRVVVVGGGLIGMMSAWELRRRGHHVLVFEEHPARPQWTTPQSLVGPASSWNGAGMLAPLGEAAEDKELFAWASRSRDLWAEKVEALEAATGVALDFDRSGAVWPIVDEDSQAEVDALADAAQAAGEPFRRLSAAEVRDLLGCSPLNLAGGLLLEGEWKIDNRRALHAVYDSFEGAGGTIVEGARVVSVTPGREASVTVEVVGNGARQEPADRIVLAAGAWSAKIAGIPQLPVRPVRGQMVAWSGLDWWSWRGSVRSGHLYAVGRAGGRLLVGATMEEAGFDNEPTAWGRALLEQWAYEIFPSLGDAPASEHWAGLRPGHDGRPIVREVAASVMAATGHFRNGVLLAPWTAEQVVAWVEA